MTKLALLVIDGLPASSKAQDFVSEMNNYYEVYYCSFINDLSNLESHTILNKLNQKLSEVTKDHAEIVVIAVSFGAYILLHSKTVLTKYEKYIEKIVAYSPPSNLTAVNDLETLPNYLNNKYNTSNVSVGCFVRLDEYFNENTLLDGVLNKKTKIILGIKDSQLQIDGIERHYKDFEVVKTPEKHIGISSLISRRNSEWM